MYPSVSTFVSIDVCDSASIPALASTFSFVRRLSCSTLGLPCLPVYSLYLPLVLPKSFVSSFLFNYSRAYESLYSHIYLFIYLQLSLSQYEYIAFYLKSTFYIFILVSNYVYVMSMYFLTTQDLCTLFVYSCLCLRL